MKRRKEREFSLKILFASEFNQFKWQDQLQLIDDREKKYNSDFSRQLISLSTENRSSLDKEFIDKLKNWEYSRTALIDRLILRMAVAEFLYFEEIPPEVTIDEAIDIAKKYSTEKSSKFVNGILDSVLKKLKKEKRLIKKGRGLISAVKDNE